MKRISHKFAELEIQNKTCCGQKKVGVWTNAKYGINDKMIQYSAEIHTVLEKVLMGEAAGYILAFTLTTQGLGECRPRCSCRSSNTSENDKCQCSHVQY